MSWKMLIVFPSMASVLSECYAAILPGMQTHLVCLLIAVNGASSFLVLAFWTSLESPIIWNSYCSCTHS